MAAAPPPPSGLDSPALPLAVATVLVTAVSAEAALTALKAALPLSGAALDALSGVLGDVMQHPPAVTGIIGAASEQTARVNMARRAQFVVAASKRVLGAVRDARSKNQPLPAAVLAQLSAERRYYAQHQAAMWSRARAAGMVDIAAAEHGRLLGWNTVIDARTSPECRAADGKNFYSTAMPLIGFPGMPHPGCRCYPSAPHPGARLLPSGSGYVRAA